MRERNPRVRNYQPLPLVASAAKGNHQPHLVRERNPNPNQPRHFHQLRGSIQEIEKIVGDRRRGQGASTHGYGKGILEQSTSFFFTNFPKDWQIGEVWKAFIRCGKVIQIYVARKRDKWRRRFCFARFLDVKSTRELEIKLNQIFVGDQYIKANIAIFSREETKLKRKEINEAEISKEVWQSKKAMNTEQQIGHGLEVQVDKEDEEWLERSFVGKAKCPEIISSLRVLCSKAINLGTDTPTKKSNSNLEDEDSYPPGFGPTDLLGQKTNLGDKNNGLLSSLDLASQGTANAHLFNNPQKKWIEVLVDKDAKSEGETTKCNAKPQNGSKRGRKEVCVEEGNEVVKERSTQPFWEGLESDDELLQARVERIAQVRRKKGKHAKKKMVPKAKQTRSRKGFTLGMRSISGIEEHNQPSGLGLTSTRNRKQDWSEVAKELWTYGKRLGLVDARNAKQIIKHLGDMEKRHRIALAKQKMALTEIGGEESSHP
ncbi:hypothetical protein SLEP1_g19971 [Rubroshorea leprosula]|uniref:RRM domain-containing protein n=1 Tax=Rubroshorea leprosula TaxID=152421 RepID=A0AAV5JA70_9ROSI|nr:hypothetical protein SLEP1_g19971 [Rubroshorea leprosula]